MHPSHLFLLSRLVIAERSSHFPGHFPNTSRRNLPRHLVPVEELLFRIFAIDLISLLLKVRRHTSRTVIPSIFRCMMIVSDFAPACIDATASTPSGVATDVPSGSVPSRKADRICSHSSKVIFFSFSFESWLCFTKIPRFD